MPRLNAPKALKNRKSLVQSRSYKIVCTASCTASVYLQKCGDFWYFFT